MFGDTLQTFQFEPATEGFYQYLKDFSAEAVPNRTLGYVFDTAEVASEIAACTSIAQEFRPMLECGVTSDVAETLRVFNEELARAGMDKIIKENQKQLDAWLLRQ